MRRSVTAIIAALVGCSGGGPARRPSHDRLSQTGLYKDIATRTVMDDLIAYQPAHSLWADGASKERWMRLPRGARIDTSDPDHWSFPVGTQFWKQFSLDGVPLETRLIERVAATGDAELDYWMGAFIWLPDGSDAISAPEGANDVGGTAHDVPSKDRCWSCHEGEPGHILGFSLVQLGKDDGINVETLAARGLLSVPLAERYTIPGDARAAAALGTLHANCGHCHNPNGVAWRETQMVLRLSATERTVADTQLFRTTVGVSAQLPTHPPLPLRIAPGSPAGSALFHRMSVRGDPEQMPPIATELPDDEGLANVAAWIGSLAR